MAYCQNCGAEMSTNANFCPNCGFAVNGNTTQTQSTNTKQSNMAKTILTAAGTAAGISLLGSALRRRRRRYMMPPHRGMMPGPGMYGRRMHGPGGRGPGRGGHGGIGGPGGRR